VNGEHAAPADGPRGVDLDDRLGRAGGIGRLRRRIASRLPPLTAVAVQGTAVRQQQRDGEQREDGGPATSGAARFGYSGG
jgi:hypothetical protein